MFPAHSSGLPFLQVGSRHLVPLQRDWMVRQLRQAASRAGQSHWWPAEQVAEGVSLWLRRDHERDAVAIQELASRLGHALERIGEPGIAARLELEPPPVRLDLRTLAGEVAALLELEFFRALAERLTALRSDGFPSIAVTGLEEAADALCPRPRRHRAWKECRDEIEQFLQESWEAAA